MKPKNILILTHWDFDDALVQTYTLPYVKIISSLLPKGSTVYLFTLNRGDKKKVDLSEWNISLIQGSYTPFGIKASWDWLILTIQLTYFIRRKNISVIHSFCTPAGGMGYLLSKFSSKKLILDSFEPHALPMIEGNTWARDSWAFKILFWLEKHQLKRAEEVVCAVEGMVQHAQKTYGISKNRYFSKPACVDLQLFSKNKLKDATLLRNLGLQDALTCVYAGKFGGLYYEHETFLFFKNAHEFWGSKFKVLLLSGHSDDEILSFCKKVNLSNEVIVKKFVSHSEVSIYMGLADFALCPMKPLPSRRFGTPIKNGEYWALGLPVVITPNISDDSDIIEQNKIGAIWRDTSSEGCLAAIKTIDELLKNNTREELYQKIRPIAEKYRNFSIAEKVYKEIYG